MIRSYCGDETMEEEKPIQVRLGKPVLERIERVKRLSGASTTKEVFKNALTTYATLQELRDKDGSIIIEHKGKRVRIVLP